MNTMKNSLTFVKNITFKFCIFVVQLQNNKI